MLMVVILQPDEVWAYGILKCCWTRLRSFWEKVVLMYSSIEAHLTVTEEGAMFARCVVRPRYK